MVYDCVEILIIGCWTGVNIVHWGTRSGIAGLFTSIRLPRLRRFGESWGLLVMAFVVVCESSHGREGGYK